MTDDTYPNMTATIQSEPVYALQISVYENGQRYDLDNYSGQEIASIESEINSLWRTTYNSNDLFDIRTNNIGEEPTHYTLHYMNLNDQNAPFPAEWLMKMIHVGYGKNAKALRLVGDRIPINPDQYGVNPWPADVKVLFEIY